MTDFLISSGKNKADFLYLFQKLRFRISRLFLERVSCGSYANAFFSSREITINTFEETTKFKIRYKNETV